MDFFFFFLFFFLVDDDVGGDWMGEGRKGVWVCGVGLWYWIGLDGMLDGFEVEEVNGMDRLSTTDYYR